MPSSLRKPKAALAVALVLCACQLASGAYGPIGLAQAQSSEQQAEKAAVDHVLSDYSDAFVRGDLHAVSQHCNVPFVVVSSQGVRVLPTASEIETWYGGIIRDLKERGYSHSVRSELHVKLLDQTTALASAVFVRYRTDGSELATIGATYILRKTEGDWKIAVVTPHPPGNIVRVD